MIKKIWLDNKERQTPNTNIQTDVLIFVNGIKASSIGKKFIAKVGWIHIDNKTNIKLKYFFFSIDEMNP